MGISPISNYLPGGLLATYWDTTGRKIRCIDPEINYERKTEKQGSLNPKIHNDCFTARWEGKLKVDKSDIYTLYTHVDKGVRVWVDGKVLIDCSHLNNAEKKDNAEISLTEGLHDILMEFNENYAGATAKLSWSSPFMSKRIISSANLYSPTQISNNVSPFDDLAASLNKRIGQPGWEDIIEQLSVTGTGYKNLDYNHDGRVNTTDLALASPELKNTLGEINNNIGKKEGDAGWEDVYQDVKMRKLVWKRWRPRWEEYTVQRLAQEGAKRLDLNRDGRIDTSDILALWTEKGNPEVSLDLLKKAFNRRSGELGWEDLLRPITVKGAKAFDFTVDGQIDKEDLKMYFAAMYKNGTVIQAEGDKNIYLMMNGEKVLVPDRQILEVLSLDKNGTTIIDSKELELIPTTYMDGTILRDETGKLSLMENGSRRLVERNTLRKLGMENGYEVDVQSSAAPSLGPDVQSIAYGPNRVLKSLEDKKMYLTSLKEGVKIVDGNCYTDYSLQKVGIPDETTLNALGLEAMDTTITIRAKGDAARGTYPLIQLRVDGQVAKEWFVTNNWADYSTTLPLSNGKHSIDVVYSNDQDIETRVNTWEEKVGKWWKRRTIVHTDTVHDVIADRTLWVDSIRVGEQPIQAEDV
ncbi:MAG: PA14 domain-containing protein, partial [Candidatus Desantisbacteria bacterium]